jgi:hypothetical protein
MSIDPGSLVSAITVSLICVMFWVIIDHFLNGPPDLPSGGHFAN